MDTRPQLILDTLRALNAGRAGPNAVQIAADALDGIVNDLRVSYPATPVDCLISELRDHFTVGPNAILSKWDFEQRVAQFKGEINA